LFVYLYIDPIKLLKKGDRVIFVGDEKWLDYEIRTYGKGGIVMHVYKAGHISVKSDKIPDYLCYVHPSSIRKTNSIDILLQ